MLFYSVLRKAGRFATIRRGCSGNWGATLVSKPATPGPILWLWPCWPMKFWKCSDTTAMHHHKEK